MTFKINVSEKSGKTYKLETEAESLIGKELHEKIQGNLILPDLAGYELEIVGASDKAGFTAMKEVEGIGLKRIILKYGKGMHIKPKGDKKKNARPKKGMKLRKTVRGKVISPAIIQINLKVIKEGSKKLSEVFPDQNKKETPENPSASTDNQQKDAEPSAKNEGLSTDKSANASEWVSKEKPIEVPAQ